MDEPRIIITPDTDPFVTDNPDEAMSDSDFAELVEGIKEAIASQGAEGPSQLRRSIFNDMVLTRIEEHGHVQFDLHAAMADLGLRIRSGALSIPADPADMLKLLSSELKQTQRGLAQLLGLPLATVRNWMQRRRDPDAGSVKMLRLALIQPDALLVDADLAQAAA